MLSPPPPKPTSYTINIVVPSAPPWAFGPDIFYTDCVDAVKYRVIWDMVVAHEWRLRHHRIRHSKA